MSKIHKSPEFAVIKQDQANRKFFVASGEGGQFGSAQTTPPNTASTFSEEATW